MTQSGFLWMCNQNWSTLSLLKILHFHNKVQKSGLFLFLGTFLVRKKVTGFLAYPSPWGGVGVGEWIFLSE
jgi:hypothetical protein